MTTYYRSFTRHTFKPIRLSIFRIHFGKFPTIDDVRTSQKDTNKTLLDIFLESLELQPLQKAYVLFVPIRPFTSSSSRGPDLDVEKITLCQTISSGEIYKISENEIDKGLPRDLRERLMLFAREQYYYYVWTFSKKLFKQIVNDIKNDAYKALERYEFYQFKAVQAKIERKGNEMTLFPKMMLALRDLFWNTIIKSTTMNKTDVEGYYQGHDILGLKYGRTHHTKDLVYPYPAYNKPLCGDLGIYEKFQAISYPSRDWLFARCRTIDAFHLCELLQYQAVSPLQEAANDFAVLEAAKDICKKTEEKERSPTLDEMIKTHEFYDDYWRYAYACGTYVNVKQKFVTIDREAFKKAILDDKPGDDSFWTVDREAFKKAILDDKPGDDSCWTIDMKAFDLAIVDVKQAVVTVDKKAFEKGIIDVEKKDNKSATIKRTDFFKAIHNVQQLRISDRWFEFARKIVHEYGVLHPADTHDPGHPSEPLDPYIKVKPIYDPPILAYFDFYRFGIEKKGKVKHYERYEPHYNRISSLLQSNLKKITEKFLHYIDFMSHLDAHYDIDIQKRTNLHQRYLELMLNVQYEWWNDIGSEETWNQLKPYLEWISTLADKGGEGVQRLFGKHFESIENIQKYNEMMHDNISNIESMLHKLEHINERLGGDTVPRKVPLTEFDADINLETGEITIRQNGQKLGKYTFLRREVPLETRYSNGKYYLRKGYEKHPLLLRRFRPEKRKLISFEVSPSFKEFNQWPSWLEAFGDGISLAMSLINLSKDLKKKHNIDICMELFKNTFQFIDSFSSALYASYKYSYREIGMVSRFAKFGKIMKGPGMYLEAYLNVNKGINLLYSEDSEVYQALKENKTFEAKIKTAQGVVLIGSVVPGAVSAGSGAYSVLSGGTTVGAAMGVTAGLFAIGLLTGSIIYLGLDICQYMHEGPESYMELFEKDFIKAYERELGEGKSRTFDALDDIRKGLFLLKA